MFSGIYRDATIYKDFKCPECAARLDLRIRCKYTQPAVCERPASDIKVTKIVKEPR